MDKDKKYISSKDIISDETLHDIIMIMGDRLTHIEDAILDYREILIKLVKQSNQVVSFLKQLEADVDEQYGITAPPSFDEFTEDYLSTKDKSIQDGIQDLIYELIERNKDLEELEKELEKNKHNIIPGQIGES